MPGLLLINVPASMIILPVAIPLFAGATGLLLYNRRRLQAVFSFSAMLAAAASSLLILLQVWMARKPLIFQLGAWQAPFGITLVADLLSGTMVVMAQLVLSLGFLYALGSKDQVVRYPTFYPLFLTLAAGLSGALLSGDVFNLFVFAELLVISGTLLTSISDDRLGIEAAYKYFYISLLASVFLLIASGSLYVSYGTLNMADLAQRISADPERPLLGASMIFLLATFMIKAAVFPFHFWQPDFHTTSPTPVSAMLSSVVVKLGVYGFLRMTTLLFVPFQSTIQDILLVLGAIGVVFGGLGAVGSHNVKRMLAYSTLAQVGFILVAIGWGTPLALAAAIVFTFNHSLIKSAMLMLAGVVASRAPAKTAAISALTGIGKEMPLAGALFLIGGMSLAGLPPTNGFVNKLSLFLSGVESGAYTSLAVLAAASLLTLVYVVRAFQRIWWQPPSTEVQIKPEGDKALAPAILIALCLLLGLWGEPLLQLAQATARWMINPASYIAAVIGG